MGESYPFEEMQLVYSATPADWAKDFKIQTNDLIPVRGWELVSNKKKTTFNQVNFAVPSNHRGKMKKPEKIEKYLVLARELNSVKHSGVNCGTVPKGMGNLEELKIRVRIKTIQKTTLLRLAWIFIRVLKLNQIFLALWEVAITKMFSYDLIEA